MSFVAGAVPFGVSHNMMYETGKPYKLSYSIIVAFFFVSFKDSFLQFFFFFLGGGGGGGGGGTCSSASIPEYI